MTAFAFLLTNGATGDVTAPMLQTRRTVDMLVAVHALHLNLSAATQFVLDANLCVMEIMVSRFNIIFFCNFKKLHNLL